MIKVGGPDTHVAHGQTVGGPPGPIASAAYGAKFPWYFTFMGAKVQRSERSTGTGWYNFWNGTA